MYLEKMFGLEATLSKLCCCFDIEFGGFLVGVTRLVLHLIRVMIAVILLMGGIKEGGKEEPDDGNSTTVSTTTASSLARIHTLGFGYHADTHITNDETKEYATLLHSLAVNWVIYYTIYFCISFVYCVGIKMVKWWMMIPMLVMAGIDMIAPAFLGAPSVIFFYIMDKPYDEPAIMLKFLFEGCLAVFGLYIFSVIWGCLLFIKTKADEESQSGKKIDQDVQTTDGK